MTRLIWILALALALPAFGQAPTRVVSTIADLDALYPGSSQPHVLVQGFSTSGDWGAPKAFRWDSTNALSTNAIRRATRNGVGRWVHDWDGDLRVWGVKADGSTDDTAAVDAAFSYALGSANETETLVFPPGTMIHSGISIAPTKHKLLRLRGSSANSATAVEPFGSRLLLKPGSTNVLFSVALSPSYRLRFDVQGLYFDGNRDNCTNATDVLRITGDGTSYLSVGSWQDCAFNRGNRHGILLTNAVYQFKATRVNCQSNRDTGIWTDRGGDHHFTSFLSEKSGGNGVYHYATENTTYQDSDVAFNGGNGVYLLDCRKLRFVNCDLSVAGKSCVVLEGGAYNNMFHSSFVNCRIGSPNSSLSGVPTTYPSGTYSTVTLSGSSGSHWGHVFENCMVLAFEANDSTKPKNVFEDARSNIQWTTYPGGGVTLIGCAVSSATNYTVSGPYSTGFTQNANLVGTVDHGGAYGATNSVPSFSTTRSFDGLGVSTFGAYTNTNPALRVLGGVSASSLITLDRQNNAKIGFSISGDTFRITDETNATQIVAFNDDSTTSTLFLGGQGTPRTGRIYNGNPTGTDSAALPLRMFTWGTGSGSLASANFEVYSPTTGVSGSSVQTTYRTFAIQGAQSGKRTPMLLWDNEAGTLRNVTTTNLTSPVTGTATLVAGSATVTNSVFSSNSIPMLTYKSNPTLGGVAGVLSGSFSATNANGVLTITSTSGTDTNQVFWLVAPRTGGANEVVLHSGKYLIFE